ncbi:MAG: hypothetical protein QOK42_347 [Frankiaceae bacterium]|nr:hypothetical protein [Frankiaceae bacterium]
MRANAWKLAAVSVLTVAVQGCASSSEPLSRSTGAPSLADARSERPTPTPSARVTVAPRRTASRAPSSTPTANRSVGTPAPRRTSSPAPRRTTTPRPSTSSASPKAGALHVVHMADFSFSPASLTIDVGDRVRAINDMGSHTFTGTSGPKTWDSGAVAQGQSYTVTFSSVGDYTFVCSYHQSVGMTGTITVR